MKRIICVGSRTAAQDAAGPAVYDHLAGRPLPPGVELMDGGLAGLDLLRWVEGAEQVVFVDGVSGFGAPGAVLVLAEEEAAALSGSRYDHAAGLSYLLRLLPEVCEGPRPRVSVVGIEGPPDPGAVREAAAAALQIAGGSGHGSGSG